MRRGHAQTLLWAVLFSVCGCQTTTTGPTTAPRPRPIQPTNTPPPAVGTTGDSMTPTVPDISYYQLTLLSEESNESDSTGVKLVHLERGQARAVGEVLALLVIPSGPTGTTDRYALLYPSELEWKLATERAGRLDAPVLESLPDTPPQETPARFQYGLGILYGTPRHHPEAEERYRMASQAFAVVAEDTGADPHTRWAAAMLDGAVHAERLFAYAESATRYAQAEPLAVPGSYEQMVALYLRSGALVQEGRNDDASKLLSRVLSEFSAYRTTEVYDRARKLFGEVNR